MVNSEEKLNKLYGGLPLLADAVMDKNVIDNARIASVLNKIGLEQDETVSSKVENFIRIALEIYIDDRPDKERAIKRFMALGIPRNYVEPVVDMLVVLPVPNQGGTYFKETYNHLKSLAPQLPSDDPPPNIQICIVPPISPPPYGPNFHRAAFLARKHNLSPEIVRELRELTIMQYILDFKNFPGLKIVIKELKFTPMEFNRVYKLIQEEKYYPCFSFDKATEKANEQGFAKAMEQMPQLNEINAGVMQYVVDQIQGWAEEWYGR